MQKQFDRAGIMFAAIAALASPAFAQARATAAAPISIRFAATVGETPFSCTGKFAGIGTTASTIQVTDFRFFASNVRLVRADGAEVPVKLT